MLLQLRIWWRYCVVIQDVWKARSATILQIIGTMMRQLASTDNILANVLVLFTVQSIFCMYYISKIHMLLIITFGTNLGSFLTPD